MDFNVELFVTVLAAVLTAKVLWGATAFRGKERRAARGSLSALGVRGGEASRPGKSARWLDRTLAMVGLARLSPFDKVLYRHEAGKRHDEHRELMGRLLLLAPEVLVRAPEIWESLEAQDRYLGELRDLALARRLIHPRWEAVRNAPQRPSRNFLIKPLECAIGLDLQDGNRQISCMVPREDAERFRAFVAEHRRYREALDWIEDNGPDDALDLRERAREALRGEATGAQ